MDGKPVDIRTAMQTRNAILTYLRGEESLVAVLRAIETTGDLEAARHFIRDLDGYGDADLRESLRRHLEAQAAA
jgi:hypothetical protein